MELHTVPHRFGAKSFGKVNSLFRGSAQQKPAEWRGEQLVGSCIPESRSSSGVPRGQYANWARPPDALMGTAFSFQSELLESYSPSLHSGETSNTSQFELFCAPAVVTCSMQVGTILLMCMLQDGIMHSLAMT